MGDIWPYGPPKFVTWVDAFDAARAAGFTRGQANVAASIAEAESALDVMVVNDTPATGDYSVGAWQINYFGNLRAGRVAEFGRPGHLARSGITGQARAAFRIWQEQGFGAWSTYNHGDYKQYLSGNVPVDVTAGHRPVTVPVPTNPRNDSWSPKVGRTAGHLDGAWHTLNNYANAIHGLR